MQHLVEQVLDLARTQPELLPARFNVFDLHALAERVTAELWPDFDDAGLSLSLTGERAPIRGDEGMLETLLRNLLDNARKYAGEPGEVEVSVMPMAGGAQLRVTDHGPGIAESDRQRVFERFYRAGAGAEGRASGAGLGLAIVLQIVQLHGAHIDLESPAEGSGLSVVVDFPAGATA
jgi:signal transduction histidine kinase